jgi:hypothetical protein
MVLDTYHNFKPVSLQLIGAAPKTRLPGLTMAGDGGRGGRLRQLNRTATFAWSPGAHLPFLAVGTVAGALDASFSTATELEIVDLGLDSYGVGGQDGVVRTLGQTKSPARCVSSTRRTFEQQVPMTLCRLLSIATTFLGSIGWRGAWQGARTRLRNTVSSLAVWKTASSGFGTQAL